MQFFYSQNITNEKIILDENESRHCFNALRYKIGDHIKVVNGSGDLFTGEIYDIKDKKCHILINQVDKEYLKRKQYVHIAISPIKNHDRIEWFVEKVVELGVEEISFIDCSRTIRKNIRMNRINKVAVSAMKQSLKAYMPKINDIISFDDFIQSNKVMKGYMCYLSKTNKKFLNHYKKEIVSHKSYILIGPEGDFDKNEILVARNNGINFISLGESRLRTETAGVVACHLMNLLHV